MHEVLLPIQMLYGLFTGMACKAASMQLLIKAPKWPSQALQTHLQERHMQQSL
jgi:hypothetical protein